MTRLRLGGFLTLLCCALMTPSLVSAKAIEDVLLGSDAQDIMITILADSPLNAPTVRTYAGSLRVRLYDTKETPLLKITGDGGAVRSLDVANGSDQTAAIVVNFTDRTRLNPTDVRIEREGAKVVLRIARGLLPALREGASSAAKPAPVPAPVAPPVTVREPAPAPTAAAAPAKQEPAKPAPVAKQEPTLAPTPKKTTLGQPAPKPDTTVKDLKLAPRSESSTMPILIAVSALLALCYGVLRLVMKKQAGVEIPAIDVVAQKRLGPRHQLVIVRAFDRDYLLSIQGGQTTVVARSSRGKQSGDREPTGAMQLPFQRAPVGELELAPPSGSLRAPAKPASAPPKAAPKRPEPFEDDEVTFGGELFKAALEQRERQRDERQRDDRQRDPTQSNLRLEAARAEARAELARLESERDDYQAAIKPSLPGARVAEEEMIEAPKAADAMMSEAVSGLLRLRKASGR
jgi:hypothetical protein